MYRSTGTHTEIQTNDLYIIIAAAGVLSTLQTGTSSTLDKRLGHPMLAALLVEVVGALTMVLALLAYTAYTRHGLPAADHWRSVPWWAWVGGCLGAIYVLSMVMLSSRVGAGVFIGLTVTAGIVTSIAMDHYALLGMDRHPAGIGRISGALLMIAGLFCVARF